MRTRTSYFVSRRDLRLRPLALAIACVGAGSALAASPFPQGGVTVRGIADVGAGSNGAMTIGQTSARAIINWNDFSLAAGNTLNITQSMGPGSVLLNRVMGIGNRSDIFGTINAPGRVFIVNPAGVVFGATSQVNVGGLVASTLKMSTSDDDFMGGTEHFEFKQGNDGFSNLNASGTITAPGGTVALISGSIDHSGTINARGGTAALVSGDKVTLDPFGDGLTTFTVSAGLYSSVTNTGTLRADGGRVVLMATGGTEISGGVVNVRGVLRADSLASRGGEIVLDSGSSAEGVTINGGVISASDSGGSLKGGNVDISGRTILLQPYVAPIELLAAAFQPPTSAPDTRGIIDASGGTGGGTVKLHAVAVGGNPQTGAIAVAAGSTISADATRGGNGGVVRLFGERTLRVFGNLSARGGPAGGNGGFIETSGGYAVPAGDNNGGISLDGVRVDASAPAGTAGTWLVDPYDVTITHGAGSGVLPPGVFDPIATSTIQDGDINVALNGGTDVHITTGVGGDPTQGNIEFDDAQILYNTAAGARTFTLDAHRSVRANAGTTIASFDNGGPLNVVFNAGANGADSIAAGGGQVSYSGSLYTNGGNVAMSGNWANNSNSMTSVHLDGPVLDTRAGNKLTIGVGYTGGSDLGPGGSVLLVGRSTGTNDDNSQTSGAVWLDGGLAIRTATGNVTLLGTSTGGHGVEFGESSINTTSGAVSVTGVGSFTANSVSSPGHGVVMDDVFSIGTVSGDIAVRGLRLPGGDVAGTGVTMSDATVLQTTGGGNIEVTGQSSGNGAGVDLGAGVINGSRNVVLRASNDGSTDAVVLDGPVSAAGVLNLRPGGLDVTGAPENLTVNAVDRLADPITLGGASATGFAVSASEFGNLTAPTIVVGSNAHAGDINGVGAIANAGAITLQNGGGGNIALSAPVTTGQLGLLSAGNITQTAGAPITAGTLLARSTGGNVLLDQAANNVSASTLGGSAAGAFRYVDVDALRVGSVSVTGYDAAGNQPQISSATSMAADTVFLRTLSGDLTLATNVSSTSGADLVAAARFQNLGAFGIFGAPWRVWADTWTGESRGGMAGSGLTPNLYHCAYLGLCTVSITPANNHFIYAQQPRATVVLGNATRPFGQPNPPFFTYSVTGLILGDTPAGFAGSTSTTANLFSPPGLYPINGIFDSAAGYAVNVVPGTLRVSQPQVLTLPEVVRDVPNTYTFDRNIGPVPMCFATGPLNGDRAAQGADVLAREWSRVRSRPNLLSCVDTERRNGCADF